MQEHVFRDHFVLLPILKDIKSLTQEHGVPVCSRVLQSCFYFLRPVRVEVGLDVKEEKKKVRGASEMEGGPICESSVTEGATVGWMGDGG